MSKYKNLLIFALVALLLVLIGWAVTPTGRANVNEHFYSVQKADDATRYATRKKVEDSCRAMIASYTGDKITFEQYKDSGSEEKQSWAEQARIRANKTAAAYNEYILKNSFVWAGNIPADIQQELPYI